MVKDLERLAEGVKNKLKDDSNKIAYIINLTKLQAERLKDTYLSSYYVKMDTLHSNYPNPDVATYILSVGVKNA